MGRLWLAMYRGSTKEHSDPLMRTYLENLIYRLSETSEVRDRRFEFIILEDKTINAFAAPGGIIGINLGMFLNTQKEGELASVMCHELAHLSQRHFARSQNRNSPLANALMILGSIAVAAASRNPIASFRGGNDNNRLDVYVDNSGGTAHMGLGAYNLAGGATELGFYTGASVTEQMRLSSTGGLGIGITTTGNYALNVSRSENQPIVAFQNTATSQLGPGCIQTSLNGGNQNNTSCHHFKATTQGVNSWYLYGNGTSSFSSDEKLK